MQCEGPGCRRVPVSEISAAMVRLVFGVDLVRVVHPTIGTGTYASCYCPSLHRPVLWTSTVQ